MFQERFHRPTLIKITSFCCLSIFCQFHFVNYKHGWESDVKDFFISGLADIVILVIYLIAVRVSSIRSVINHNIYQILILVFCVFNTYIITLKICQVNVQTEEEYREMTDNYTRERYRNKYEDIDDEINSGYRFNPSAGVYKKDSIQILNALKLKLSQPIEEMDRKMAENLSLLCQLPTVFFTQKEFSNELRANRHLIDQTLQVQDIFYSPKNSVFVLFVSFYSFKNDLKIKKPNAIKFLGYKRGNEYVLFETYRSKLDQLLSVELMYADCFFNDQDIMNYAFLKEAYWDSKNVTKSVSIGDTTYYGFETKKVISSTYAQPSEPLFELLEPSIVLEN